MTTSTSNNLKPLPNIKSHFPNQKPFQPCYKYGFEAQGIYKLIAAVDDNRKALITLQKGYPEKAKALEKTVNRIIKQLGSEISEVLEPKLRERLMEVFAQAVQKYHQNHKERITKLEEEVKDLRARL